MLKQTDEELMLLVKMDESLAMTELVKRYQANLFNFFYRMSGDKFLAEDLVQESFIRLYKYRANYKDKNPLNTWLFQIARNVWNTSFRQQQKKPQNDQQITIRNLKNQISNPSDYYETQQLIKTALLQLPERDRELIILFHLKGFTHKELSTVFKVSEGTLRVILYRALKKLGVILKNMGYEAD